MAALTINGTEVKVKVKPAPRGSAEVLGSDSRTATGAMNHTDHEIIEEWTFTTPLLTATEKDNLIGLVDSLTAPALLVAGDLVGSSITCYGEIKSITPKYAGGIKYEVEFSLRVM